MGGGALTSSALTYLVSFPDSTLEEGKGSGTSKHILGLAVAGCTPQQTYKPWI